MFFPSKFDSFSNNPELNAFKGAGTLISISYVDLIEGLS